MATTFITPVDITPAVNGAWTDADVSSYVPAGTTGVILHVGQSSGADKALGFRCNGSTDARTQNTVGNKGHFWIGVGVDANRVLEIYTQDYTIGYVSLVGYFTSEAAFFTNGVDKSLGSTGAWTDIDISSDTGTNTAIGAIFEIVCGVPATYNGGLRKNGSTDERLGGNAYQRYWGSAIIGVDASEICEGYISDTNHDFFLLGYIMSQATFNTNATDVSIGATDTWTDMTALPAGSIGGIIEVAGGGGTTYYGFRVNGSSEAKQGEDSRHNWGMVQCDANGIIEGLVNNLASDFFLNGYFSAAPITYIPRHGFMHHNNPALV